MQQHMFVDSIRRRFCSPKLGDLAARTGRARLPARRYAREGPLAHRPPRTGLRLLGFLERPLRSGVRLGADARS